jgi:thioredoxin reductase
MYDVIIAGGGIAGMSAALILGRCRRSVLICDTGAPRNWASDALHGFLSRDGIHPRELRRIARAQLKEYPSVVFRQKEVTDAHLIDGGYRVSFADGTSHDCRYLLIATGIVDRVPEVEGFADLYGQSVFHCPYCDGWEMRDQPIAVYGSGDEGAEYALELTGWTSDIVLCLDGGPMPPEERLKLMEANGVGLRPEKIVRLESNGGVLDRIVFESGEPLPRRAVFFSPDQFQASVLAEKLGCSIVGGAVETKKLQQTHERMFVAGDAARSVQLAIVAASEGVEAAFAINTALLKEMLKRP